METDLQIPRKSVTLKLEPVSISLATIELESVSLSMQSDHSETLDCSAITVSLAVQE